MVKLKLLSFYLVFLSINLNAQQFDQIAFPNENELNAYFLGRYEQLQEAILENIKNNKLKPYKNPEYKTTYEQSELKERISNFSDASTTQLNAASIKDILFSSKTTFNANGTSETQTLEGIALSGTMIIYTLYLTDQPLCWIKLTDLEKVLKPNQYRFLLLMNRYKNHIPNKENDIVFEDIETINLKGTSIHSCDSNYFQILSQTFSDQKFFFNEYLTENSNSPDSQVLNLKVYDLQKSKIVDFSEVIKNYGGRYEIMSSGDTSFFADWRLGDCAIQHLNFETNTVHFNSCVLNVNNKGDLFEFGKQFILYIPFNRVTVAILEDYRL
ncbi:MAG TPA: hypothetical protein VGF79_01690, partial [Bacteroidia bacterium]